MGPLDKTNQIKQMGRAYNDPKDYVNMNNL